MDKKEKKYPEPVAGALILDNEGKVFLAKSHKWKGKYTMSGGHIEMGETMEEAIKREVIEETGMDVEVLDYLGVEEGINNEEYHEKKHFIFVEVLCKFEGDKKSIKLNDEFYGDPLWLELEKARELDLAYGAKLILGQYFKYIELHGSFDNWKRCVADFENYKKRQAENMKEMIAYSNANLITEILPVLDNFHASTDHIPEDQKKSAWVVGIMHIQKQLEKILADNGVAEIVVKEGDKFDPSLHEAVGDANPRMHANQRIDENSNKELKIKKVLMRGYKIDNRVIRAARVVVE